MNFEVYYNLTNDIYEDDIEFREKHKRFRTAKEYDEYYTILKANRINQLNTLDSIHRKENLDTDYYNLFKTKLKYRINLLTDFSEIKKEEIELKKDTLLANKIYKYFLPNYVSQKLKIPFIKKRNIPMYDPLIIFDSVQKSDLFSTKIKNYLLYYSLESIGPSSIRGHTRRRSASCLEHKSMLDIPASGSSQSPASSQSTRSSARAAWPRPTSTAWLPRRLSVSPRL